VLEEEQVAWLPLPLLLLPLLRPSPSNEPPALPLRVSVGGCGVWSCLCSVCWVGAA
jgi:hypothetical protein